MYLFQPYKLAYAKLLAEHGLYEIAFRYVQSILETMKRGGIDVYQSGAVSPFDPDLLDDVLVFQHRLQISRGDLTDADAILFWDRLAEVVRYDEERGGGGETGGRSNEPMDSQQQDSSTTTTGWNDENSSKQNDWASQDQNIKGDAEGWTSSNRNDEGDVEGWTSKRNDDVTTQNQWAASDNTSSNQWAASDNTSSNQWAASDNTSSNQWAASENARTSTATKEEESKEQQTSWSKGGDDQVSTSGDVSAAPPRRRCKEIKEQRRIRVI